ncbi:MAG: UPF0175 family protein [Xenococcus sp. (in: cyanobacteria)]
MTDISIQLPDEVFSSFSCTPQDFIQKMKLAAAIHWYQKGEISQEKAARIAGLNHRDFLMSLAEEKIDVSTVNINDVEQEKKSEKQKFIRSLRGKYKNRFSSSEDFSQQKQKEIDWEERNQ